MFALYFLLFLFLSICAAAYISRSNYQWAVNIRQRFVGFVTARARKEQVRALLNALAPSVGGQVFGPGQLVRGTSVL